MFLSSHCRSMIIICLSLLACRTDHDGGRHVDDLIQVGKGPKPAPSAGPESSQSVASTPTSPAFVQVTGTGFVLDGRTFAFHGTNFYRLAVRDVRYSDADVKDIMKKTADSGMRVIRFWGFSCDTPSEWREPGVPDPAVVNPPILERDGSYNEDALTYLDRVIAAAGNAGLKVILPLVNFEPSYCGMGWWSRVYGSLGESKQSFYCNPTVISAFKKYIATILNRVNTANGLQYKNDPSIMAIEVANEPHTTDNYETSDNIDASCKALVTGKPGDLVYKWLSDITAYVRSIDTNHLIATGEEGYRVSGDRSRHGWLHDGSKGIDFDRNVKLPNVSFASVHFLLDNWGIPQSDFYSWFVPNIIADRARIAHAAGKPIVLEEVGFSSYKSTDVSGFMSAVKSNGYYSDRSRWLSETYKAANNAGYAGTMIWQAIPNRPDGTPYHSDYFSFGFNDPAMTAIKEQVEVQKTR